MIRPEGAIPSDRHAAWHTSRDLQQVRFHGDDLVLAVPFAWDDVFQVVGLEADPFFQAGNRI